MKRVRRLIAAHAVIFFAIAAYIFCMQYFRIYCPIKYIIGYPCPACGSSRAMLSLLSGDIAAYFQYNPFALPLLSALLLEAHFDHLGRAKKAATVFTIVTVSAAFVYNLLRIFYF